MKRYKFYINFIAVFASVDAIIALKLLADSGKFFSMNLVWFIIFSALTLWSLIAIARS